jgi:hypothetical protein
VNQRRSNILATPQTANSDTGVFCAIEHLFGNNLMLKDITKSIGLNFGSEKTFQSVNYLFFQDTANPSLKVSKITGSNKTPSLPSTILILSILSMMALTFTRTAVSWFL